MVACSQCGKEYPSGAAGWYSRIEGLGPAGRVDMPLRHVLLCPDDFKKIPARQRMAWHEFTGRSEGPTREKRPGRLGQAD
jgi:hypothetical protein